MSMNLRIIPCGQDPRTPVLVEVFLRQGYPSVILVAR